MNGEASYGIRPWRVFGEGPTRPKAGHMGEGRADPFTSADIRFTTKGGALYAILMDWPEGETQIAALGLTAAPATRIERVELLGGGPLEFSRTASSLGFRLPPNSPRSMVPAVRIRGTGLDQA